MGEIIDGKQFANIKLHVLAKEISTLDEKLGLAAIIVGTNIDSQIYIKNKGKIAEKLGISFKKISLEYSVSQEELLLIISDLNKNKKIHGILVQSPLPDHIDENLVHLAISPLKDVDCFHPYNLGKILIGKEENLIAPCTPYGCLLLLHHYKVSLKGKHCVVVGRSNIVGKPMAILLMQKNFLADATVTVVHSQSQNFKQITSKADVLIVAIGKANFINSDMVKEGAIVLDVGINRIDDPSKKSGFRLCGDVDFDDVFSKVSLITPVPGGIGPVTVFTLMKNTLSAYKKQKEIEE